MSIMAAPDGLLLRVLLAGRGLEVGFVSLATSSVGSESEVVSTSWAIDVGRAGSPVFPAAIFRFQPKRNAGHRKS